MDPRGGQQVQNIHEEGGSFLGTARGGYDEEKIISFLKKHGINQLYIVGGDGTHRGAYALGEAHRVVVACVLCGKVMDVAPNLQACTKANLNISVCGIPKTIDNDLAMIDRSFGFQSAVEAAQVCFGDSFRCRRPATTLLLKDRAALRRSRGERKQAQRHRRREADGEVSDADETGAP
jgi:6-phosphofructokinase